MASPTAIPDREVYRGDPYELKFVFKNADESVRDISTAVWVAELKGDEDWEVVTDEAAQGILKLRLTGEQTARLTAPYVVWDLADSVIWGRTVFTGRLKMEGQVQ